MSGTDNQGAPVRAGTDSFQHARAELLARRASDLAPKAAPPARVAADGASTPAELAASSRGERATSTTTAGDGEVVAPGDLTRPKVAPARLSSGAYGASSTPSSDDLFTGVDIAPESPSLTIDFAPLELDWRAEEGAAVIVGEATGLWHGASLSAFSGAHGVTL